MDRMEEGVHFTRAVYHSGELIFAEREAVDACSLQSKDSFLVVSAVNCVASHPS